MSGNKRPATILIAGAGAFILLLAACSQPARLEQMSTEEVSLPVAGQPPQVATLFITVYGEDVGGLASHYYPLPRADFEAALLKTVGKSALWAIAATPEDADYDVNVGLISLVAPKWSGTVTLETSWSITGPNRGDEVGRQMFRVETPSPFSKTREATETVARMSIESGLEWLYATLAPAEASD